MKLLTLHKNSMLILLSLILTFICFITTISVITLFCTRVPFVSLSHKKIKKILEIIDMNQDKLLYDLGCGDARFLVSAVKKFPDLKAIGFELNLWAYLRAQVRITLSRVRSQVKVYYKNFYKINLNKADIIFCYLWPSAMQKLKPKFAKELKSGTVILSYAFPVHSWIKPKIERVDSSKLYVYNLEL